MSNPNTEPTQSTPDAKQPNKTEMKNEPKRTKMVKIKTVRAIRLKDGTEVGPNREVEVSEDEATEFCRAFKGSYDFAGEVPESIAKRSRIVRAIRL